MVKFQENVQILLDFVSDSKNANPKMNEFENPQVPKFSLKKNLTQNSDKNWMGRFHITGETPFSFSNFQLRNCHQASGDLEEMTSEWSVKKNADTNENCCPLSSFMENENSSKKPSCEKLKQRRLLQDDLQVFFIG